MPDELDALRYFRDETPGPSTDAWARARAAVSAARAEEEPANRGPRWQLGRRSLGRRLGQRRMIWMAVAGAVAAAVAGLLAILLPGSPVTRGSSGPIETAAFVTRVERALSESGQRNLVGYSRAVYLPGSGITTLTVRGVKVQVADSPWTVRFVVGWSYQGNSTMSLFTATGRRVFSLGRTRAQGTVTGVSYRTGTWWRASAGPLSASHAQCGPGIDLDPGGWPAYIRHELGCGALAEGGQQRVGSVYARQLTGYGGREVFWVDPVTYLPVRAILTMPSGRQIQADFGWFTPTMAHLAEAHLSIPPGFRQVWPPGNLARPR
jgi:hypothetical protein